MNNKIKILISLILCLIVVSAATYYLTYINIEQVQYKRGTLNTNEIWSGSILVTEDIHVPEGITLTIQPGTIVKFQYNRYGIKVPDHPLSIYVYGTMKAIGTAENQIWFTSSSATPINSDWHGLYFNEASDDSVLEYCIVEYSHVNIQVADCRVKISHCISRWSSAEGIFIFNQADPIIEYCRIYQCAYNGIAMETNTHPTVRYNHIWGCNNGVTIDQSSPVLQHNIIEKNDNDGVVVCYSSSLNASYNSIQNNHGSNICVETQGAERLVIVYNNLLNSSKSITLSPNAVEGEIKINNNNIYGYLDNSLDAHIGTTHEIDARYNWWGTTSTSEIYAGFNYTDTSIYVEPFLTASKTGDSSGETITASIDFGYDDNKLSDLGYRPGDPLKDQRANLIPLEDSTRKILGRYLPGDLANDVTSDGTYIYVAQEGIVKMDKNGTLIETYHPPFRHREGIAYHNGHIWLNTGLGTIKEYDLATNTVFSEIDISSIYGNERAFFTWAEGDLYILTNGNVVTKMNEYGTIEDTKEISGLPGSMGIEWDGSYFWTNGPCLSRFSYDEGKVVGYINGVSFNQRGLGWDGECLWASGHTYETWIHECRVWKVQIKTIIEGMP